MRINKPESPQRTLYVGFGLLILLIVGMAAHDYWSRQVIKQRVDEIVYHYAAKERLIREMLHLTRYRAMLMYEMLLEEDPFQRDELTQRFRALATDFYLKREQLEELGLDEEEKKIFDLAREQTRLRYLAQEDAVSLIEDERIEAAREIILEEARPAHHPQLATLQELVDYQELRMSAVLNKAEGDFQHEQEAVIVISLAGGIIALLIAVFVIRETTALYRLAELAKREAEGASKAKADFLARMSHEIRTPLNAINGMTELMQGTKVTQEQAGFLNIMRTSGNALMSLINDILDFSKIEAGKLELELIPFTLRDCVLESLEIRASAAAAKGLTLSYWVDPDLPSTLEGDPSRIRQVLINLIGNAVKFTTEGEVSLKVTQGAPSDPDSPSLRDSDSSGAPARLLLRFEVSDTGTGISNDQVQRLFSAYDQSDASISRRFGGTGLGLNISQFLVTEMGGRIGVKSDLGRGTIFSFVLPLTACSDPETEDSASAKPLQGKRILVLNPHDTHRRTIHDILSSKGAEVADARQPTETWPHLTGPNPVDAVIVDLGVAMADEPPWLESLRGRTELAALPIVLLTDVGVSTPLGADDRYLRLCSYPIRPEQLLGCLVRSSEGSSLSPPDSPDNSEDEKLARLHPLRILLVEDSEMNRSVATSMLKRFGYVADMAVNGREGVKAADRGAYDLILMDIQMPELDGIDATKEILAKPRKVRPYIVAMTANAMAGDRERYLAAGMDDYLPKPVQLKALRELILRSPSQLAPDGLADQEASEDNDSSPLGFLDQDALVGLRKLAGRRNDDLIPYLQVYLREANEWIEALEALPDSPEADQVVALAHPLKSNSRQIGATELGGFCAILEAEARAGTLQGFVPQREQIVSKFRKLRVRLESFLQG